MVGDHEWQWSEEAQDYYKWKKRDVPGKAHHDLIWARSLLSHEEPRKPAANAPSPSATASVASSAMTASHATLPYEDHSLPYQLSKLNFPSIFEVQERYQAPDIIQLDPTSRLNNSSPSYLYRRLNQRPQAVEDASFTTGPRTITPSTSVGTSRSEHDGQRNDDASVRTASPTDPQVLSRLETLSITSEPGFETIRNPRGYFKKGRAFKVLWPEPRGDLVSSASVTSASPVDSASQPPIPQVDGAFDSLSIVGGGTGTTALHIKPRIFVVVRQRAQHSLCLPVYTYSQQGTSKPGVKAEDHAPLIRENTELEVHPDEQPGKLRKPIYLILEDPTIQWSPLSRINLSKVHSVEYNLKVKTVGRVAPDCLPDLEVLFREAIGLSEE